jgi:hypothetical protein
VSFLASVPASIRLKTRRSIGFRGVADRCSVRNESRTLRAEQTIRDEGIVNPTAKTAAMISLRRIHRLGRANLPVVS